MVHILFLLDGTAFESIAGKRVICSGPNTFCLGSWVLPPVKRQHRVCTKFLLGLLLEEYSLILRKVIGGGGILAVVSGKVFSGRGNSSNSISAREPWSLRIQRIFKYCRWSFKPPRLGLYSPLCFQQAPGAAWHDYAVSLCVLTYVIPGWRIEAQRGSETP